MLGRRGPAQAAYTNPELRELADARRRRRHRRPGRRGARRAQPRVPRVRRRRRHGAAQRRDRHRLRRDARRRASPSAIVLRFLASPVEILGATGCEGVRIVRNELTSELRAQPTGDDRGHRVRAGAARRSATGAAPIPGVPFDDGRATIHNYGGRVTREGTEEPVPGVYTAGWIKRGPSGVIGTNKKCAQETVDAPARPTTRPGALAGAVDRRRASCSMRSRTAAWRSSTTPAGSASTPTRRASASRTAARGSSSCGAPSTCSTRPPRRSAARRGPQLRSPRPAQRARTTSVPVMAGWIGQEYRMRPGRSGSNS